MYLTRLKYPYQPLHYWSWQSTWDVSSEFRLIAEFCFFLIHQQISRNFYSIIIRISIKAQLPVVSSFAFSKAILKLIRRFFSSRCSGFLICRSLQARKEDEILTLIFFVPPIMSVPDIRTLFSLAKHISWISSAMFNDIAYFFPSTAPFRSNVSVRARCCKAVEIKVSEASF